MSKPHKGRKRSSGAAKGSKEHGGDKKASGASTSADKKSPEATEKKTTSPTSPTGQVSPTSPGTSQPPGAQASSAGHASKKQPAATDKKESTMKPTESKGSLLSKAEPAKTEPAKKEHTKTDPAKTEPAKTEPPKTEPVKKESKKTEPVKKEPTKTEPVKPEPTKTEPVKTEPAKKEPEKSAQPTKPADSDTKQHKDHAAPKSPTKPSGRTAPSKQPRGEKAVPSQGTKPSEAKPKEETKSKTEKAAIAGAAVATAVAGGAATAAVVSSNKSAATKEDKKPLAAGTASPAGMEDALDELMGTLEGPEDVPKTPEYTGPIVSDPATSTTIKKLGEDDNTIPPEYRHLLDGKDSSGKPIKPEEVPTTPMDEEDLVAALSSDFTCATSPEKKKPKLDEPKVEAGGMDSALDELMGTLEGPGEKVPEAPTYTGPEITEAVTSEEVDPLGIHDGTIPPAYRHLLDGKVDGKAVPPPKPESPKPMSDADLVDAFSMDFVCTLSTLPGEPEQPLGDDDLVDALSAGFTCSAPLANTEEKVDEGIVDDSALDELMGTLGGAGDPVPESPVYTGPVITETNTATYIEELGKRESSIPPEYRKLLDGKEDGKVVPPPEPEKPLSDAELADALSKDFGCSSPSTVQPAVVPEPKSSVDPKTPKAAPSEEIAACTTAASIQSAPAPGKLPPSKAPAPSDPLDALSATLGTGDQKPTDTKPAVDKVKEKTGKDDVEKLGEREDTIPPDYRLEELKDKDGKPVLPKPEAKPKPLSDTELVDAFSGDFVTSNTAATQCAPVPESKGTMKSKDVPSKEVVSSSASSTVKSAVVPAPDAKGAASADPLDALAGTLGKVEPPSKDTKPAVDKVKEKTGKEKGEKLGEREDTIPPDYRLTEIKDKDGKPMLPKAEEKPKPMSDTELVDALTEGFVTCTSPQQSGPPSALNKDAKKSAVLEEVVSSSTASAVQASAPPASDEDVSIPDDALDLLSGTLGKREADPDENKPMVDKVKEKAKKEHIAKLGECDETIPPEYRALLDGDGKDKPVKTTIPEKPKGPQDDTAAIDALSKGFCPASPVESVNQSPKDKNVKDRTPSKPASKDEVKTKDLPKDKSGKDAPAAKPVAKDEVKAKCPEKTKEQSSSLKSDTQKTCKS